MKVEPYDPSHLDAIIQLSLRAWAPVFVWIKKTMGDAVYREFYPNGWRQAQQQAVEEVCTSNELHTWVAIDSNTVAGFVAVKQHDGQLGEIYMIAVEPQFQGRGIGVALTEHALRWMKEAGLTIAMVETGGDPGHAPARRLYEKSGFGLLPISRYFKKL